LIDSTLRDAERQELERAVGLLGRSTRTARLLEFLGSKYFQEQHEQLTEIDIATQVFGRSAKVFDPTEDAVVRVEAHRLRKKLRELYEKDDRAGGMQISLPPGTYVPSFTIAPEKPVASAPAVTRRSAMWAWAALVVVFAAVALFVMRDRSSDAKVATPASPAAAPEATSNAAGSALTELHIMAGNRGSEVIDNSGVRWMPDQHFAAGGVWSRDAGFIRGTSRPFLYAHWRTGEFGYNIPLAPGSYELRLHFISPVQVGDEKLAGFNIALNGKPLLESYDILMNANGAGIADEQVFRDVSPDKDGYVHLWFSNLGGSPMLNALELTPGTPGRLAPIRIATQPTSFVDHQGRRWRADDYYINGFHSTHTRKVSGTQDAELFGAERFGHFRYAIPVDRRGRYTVVLHFAEFYHGPQLPGGGGVGSRLFHVFCNGQTLLRDFDIYKEAGSLKVISKTFTNITPSALGKINLDFEPVFNNATVSGIEVIEEPG
jgi:hypothetical protein